MLEVRDADHDAGVRGVFHGLVAAVVAPEQAHALAAFIRVGLQRRENLRGVAALGADCLGVGVAQILRRLQKAQLHDAVNGVRQVGHANCDRIVCGVEFLGHCHRGKDQEHHENQGQNLLHLGCLLLLFYPLAAGKCRWKSVPGYTKYTMELRQILRRKYGSYIEIEFVN